MTKQEAILKAKEMGFEVVICDRSSQGRGGRYYLVADKLRFAERTMQGSGESYSDAFANIHPFVRPTHPTT
jgi:hypothetical protein